MNRPGNQQVVPISFLLDGRSVTAQPQETILQVAQKSGVDIPHLCYSEGLRADGNCRACMVEIEGERVLAPACCRQPTEGMNVQSTSDKALRSQSLALELLKGAPPATVRSRSWSIGVRVVGCLRVDLVAEPSHPPTSHIPQ